MKELTKQQQIEKSIIKKYRKVIWSKFIKAIKDYELVVENDKIMVCISGGKDSFLMAKCFQELHRHGQIPFTTKYVVMNPGYSQKHLNQIKETALILGLDIEIFDTDIFAVLDKVDFDSPCYFCAKMRRGYLYDHAKKLGCNKIALGHHFNDVIETTLLSIFYGSEVKTMLPKLHSDNYKGLELIRPLYLVKENNILAWRDYNNLKFINCACNFTKIAHIDENASKRKQIKNLIATLKKQNPHIDDNIFTSLNNINMDAILGYRKNGQLHSYLETYDD